MDLVILIGIATALFIVLITLVYLQKKKSETDDNNEPRQQRAVRQRPQDDVPRRAQIVRNQRNRLRQPTAANPTVAALDRALNEEDSDNGNEQDELPQGHVQDEKMGAKKRAKMEQKEQKRLLREQELRSREEKKLNEAKLEEERKKQEEHAADEERKKIEAERIAREDQERKDHEEYLKMKEAFSVEEEGFEEDEDEKENLLADFIKYIKENKVVVLEDLANEFRLKTQQVIDRIHELQTNSILTGVIDDRGKFIYISEDELKSVAKFIRQRGRVSIAELAESSNNLINLTPVAIN